jgi:hypothetical protein
MLLGRFFLNFSDAEWKDLIPSMGFRIFVRQALKIQENICQQETRNSFWNMSKKKSFAAEQTNGQGYAIKTFNYLPLPFHYWSRSLFVTIIQSVISEDILITKISAAIPIISKCKPMLPQMLRNSLHSLAKSGWQYRYAELASNYV